MHGQTIIFEQVLLFMVSVAIFVACFALFQIYETYYSTISANDHVQAVRDIVSAQVLQFTKFEGMNVSATLNVPEKIGDEGYDVIFTGSGLNVTTRLTGITATSDLFQLGNRYTFTGNSTSSEGKIIIYKRGNNIILE
jgi:hypothetical protein